MVCSIKPNFLAEITFLPASLCFRPVSFVLPAGLFCAFWPASFVLLAGLFVLPAGLISQLSGFADCGGGSGGRVSLAWFRRNEFRLHPSHDCVAGPPVHEATGGHAIQTYPTATWMLQITPPLQSRGTSRAKHRAGLSAPQCRRMAFRLLDEGKRAASSRHYGHTAPWNATCPAR